VYAATLAATRATTLDAVDAATRVAVDAATDAASAFLLRCTEHWFRMYQGSNHWAGYTAYLSFFRHVAELQIDYSKWQHYEAAAIAGPRFIHGKFWIVSARPDTLKVDDQNRPHCAVGPYCRWPDGRALYYWHGVQVPAEWIENAQSVDPMLVLTHSNMEQRRCLAEIIGWSKVLERLTPVTVDKHADPEVGELLRLDPMPGDDEDSIGQFLKTRCGTGRTFVMRVSPSCRTAIEAQCELARITPEQFAMLEART